MASIKSLNEDLVEAIQGFQALLASLRAQVSAEGSELTRRTLQHADAELSAYQDAFATIRATLDEQVVTDALVIERADLYLGAWTWEWAVRRQLVLLQAQVQRARQQVIDLTDGLALRVHVVRRGETFQSLAQVYLGSWQEWLKIAEANDLHPGDVLEPGTHLTIPAKR